MTAAEILKELRPLGKASQIKVFKSHGVQGEHYGVSIADLKTFQKKIKSDYQLALDLFKTKVSDAMYLAGLISDPKKMTKEDLQNWAENATWPMISEYAVAWTAAESLFGMEMGLKWIDSPEEKIASAGWATLAGVVTLQKDEELDLNLMKSLLKRVEQTIHQSRNRVKYTMNGFVIALGGAVAGLKDEALAAGKRIGAVTVDMGGTACKTPDIIDYIGKIEAKGHIGKKKKTVKC